HFLGFRGVSGRGEIFKAGGKVVKNVTGYDLCKLMAGSYGTLAALEEVTVKVLPQPEATCTVMLRGIDLVAGVRTLNEALGSPHEVSGAVYLPATSAAALDYLSGTQAVAALRLEGPEPSVNFRRERLIAEFTRHWEVITLETKASIGFWR